MSPFRKTPVVLVALLIASSAVLGTMTLQGQVQSPYAVTRDNSDRTLYSEINASQIAFPAAFRGGFSYLQQSTTSSATWTFVEIPANATCNAYATYVAFWFNNKKATYKIAEDETETGLTGSEATLALLQIDQSQAPRFDKTLQERPFQLLAQEIKPKGTKLIVSLAGDPSKYTISDAIHVECTDGGEGTPFGEVAGEIGGEGTEGGEGGDEGGSAGEIGGTAPREEPECSNDEDDDGDGTIDYPEDKGCENAADAAEGDGPADLAIAIMGSESIELEGTAEYRIGIRNAGPDLAMGPFNFRMPRPAYLKLTASSEETCKEDLASSSIVCSAIKLDGGREKVVTLEFAMQPLDECPTQYQLQAALTALSQPDPNQRNNISPVHTTRVNCTQESDLSVTLSGPATHQAGDLLNYMVAVTNEGRGTATEVQLGAVIPEGLAFNTVDGEGVDCQTPSPGQLICSLPNLASGEVMNLILQFTTTQTISCVDPVGFIVAVRANDPNLANNQSDHIGTRIQCVGADVGLTVKLDPTFAVIGERIRVLWTVTNAGPGSASAVRFRTQLIPEGLVFDAQSLPQEGCRQVSQTAIECLIASVLPGVPATIRADILVPNTATAPVKVDLRSAIASEDDTNDDNNIALEALYRGFGIRTQPGTEPPPPQPSTPPAPTPSTPPTEPSGGRTPSPSPGSPPAGTPGGGTATIPGNLYVTLDSTPTRSHQLLAGTLGDTVMRLQMRADRTAARVVGLRFRSRSAELASLAGLELFRTGETTSFARATAQACGQQSAGELYLCALLPDAPLVIPVGTETQEMVVLVRPLLKTAEQGALSGEPMQFLLSDVVAAGLQPNNGNALAEGEVFLGTARPGPNQTVASFPHITVLSKITSITNVNPDPNGTAIPTGVFNIGQFRFAAAVNNNDHKAVLSALIFNVTGNSSVDPRSYKLYNKLDSSAAKNCTPMGMNGAAISPEQPINGNHLVVCGALPLSVDTAIDSGKYVDVVLQGNIVRPGSSLQVSLRDFNSITLTSFGPNTSHNQWLDRGPVQTQGFFWIEHDSGVVNSTAYGNS